MENQFLFNFIAYIRGNLARNGNKILSGLTATFEPVHFVFYRFVNLMLSFDVYWFHRAITCLRRPAAWQVVTNPLSHLVFRQRLWQELVKRSPDAGVRGSPRPLPPSPQEAPTARFFQIFLRATERSTIDPCSYHSGQDSRGILKDSKDSSSRPASQVEVILGFTTLSIEQLLKDGSIFSDSAKEVFNL
jgi:hypothetical protein